VISYKEFHGMDLNTKERAICRENPIEAIHMYRQRTGLGIMYAKSAVEQELGMDFRTYKQVKERIAFALYFQNHLWEIDSLDDGSEKEYQQALKFWRIMKRSVKEDPPWKDGRHSGDCTNEPFSCHRCFSERHYRIADKIINFDDRECDEEYESALEVS